MAETDTSLVYRALMSSFVKEKAKIIESSQIKGVINALGLPVRTTLNSLVRGGYILPVYFRGLYYLLDPDEMKTRYLKKKSFEIVAEACNKVFGKNWYYGLGSALYLGGISKQTPNRFFILTNSRESALFRFGNNEFKIRKLGLADFFTEVKERDHLRFSSPARTITDYIYFHVKVGKKEYPVNVAKSILNTCPSAKKHLQRRLIEIYPRPYNLAVAYRINEILRDIG